MSGPSDSLSAPPIATAPEPTAGADPASQVIELHRVNGELVAEKGQRTGQAEGDRARLSKRKRGEGYRGSVYNNAPPAFVSAANRTARGGRRARAAAPASDPADFTFAGPSLATLDPLPLPTTVPTSFTAAFIASIPLGARISSPSLPTSSPLAARISAPADLPPAQSPPKNFAPTNRSRSSKGPQQPGPQPPRPAQSPLAAAPVSSSDAAIASFHRARATFDAFVAEVANFSNALAAPSAPPLPLEQRLGPTAPSSAPLAQRLGPAPASSSGTVKVSDAKARRTRRQNKVKAREEREKIDEE